MKQTLFNLLSILALLFSLANAPQPAFASAMLQEIKADVTPTAISYQGMVRVNGQPFSGTGYFKFAIVSSDGNTTHWSNDGTSNGGTPPTNPVPLPVSEGLFSVRLGDLSQTGMSRVIDGQTMWMAGKDCRLRVWFSPDGVSAYTLLSPDRPFSSAPFALVSEYAVESSTLDGYSVSDFALASHNHDGRYQPTMDNICPAGYAFRSIDSAGGYTCTVLRPKPGLEHNSIASPDNGGEDISMAIGADGLPVISYYADYSLYVAHCDDLTCNSATISLVDNTTTVGLDSSIAIGKDGLPVISYYDYINQDLKFAHCNTYNCATSNKRTLDSANRVGEYSSITIGGDGYPVISYHDGTNNDLKVAKCTNTLCTSFSTTTVDNGTVTNSSSITLAITGYPIISYRESSSLKVAYCQNNDCTSRLIYTIDSSVNAGMYSSITIGSDTFPIISYYDSTTKDLKVAHCISTICSASTTYSLWTWEDSGRYNSIIIGSDGLPIIAFNTTVSTTDTGYLFVVHCSSVACDTWKQVELANETNNTGMYTSIAVGMDGLPIISYYNDNNGDVEVIHCANTLCGSYRRGR